MAEMTIQLRCDPATGKKDIVVSLSSDEDLLPHEHEQMHRQLVDKLMEGGLLNASEVGQLVIEREEEEQINTPQSSQDSTPQSQSEGA